MAQFRLTWLLLTPSLISGITIACVTLAFIGLNAWVYISETDAFAGYLFGESGIVTILLAAPDWSVFLRTAVLNSPMTYNALIIAAAAAIGFIVYEVLEISRRTANGSANLWYRLLSPTADIKAELRANIVRLQVRIMAILSWTLYWIAFMALLVPFCISLLQLGIDSISLGSLWGWLLALLAAVLFAFCIHLHIVFIRMVLLRPRIFGGVAVELAGLN